MLEARKTESGWEITHVCPTLHGDRSVLFDAEIDGSHIMKATCKWDGCVHLTRVYPYNDGDDDYIHICDLPGLIKDLQALLKIAEEEGYEM